MNVDETIKRLREDKADLKEVVASLEDRSIKFYWGTHWTPKGQQQAIDIHKNQIVNLERQIEELEKLKAQLAQQA